MKKAMIIILLLGCCIKPKLQELMNRDSMLHLLQIAKEDTNKVFLYINIGQQYENSEPKKAKTYYKLAGVLSKKIKYPLGIIKYIVNYTYVLNMEGLYDSSLLLNLQSVDLSRKINDSSYLAKTLFNSGTSYRQTGDFENAVKCYEEGKKIFNNLGDETTEGQADDILQTLYWQMHNYLKGVEYGERAVALLRRSDQLTMLGSAYTNLGLNYLGLKQYEKANMLFKQALALAKKTHDINMEQAQYMNLGDVALQKGQYELLKPYYERALILAQEIEAHEAEMVTLKGLSIYYQYKKDYEKARKYANLALDLSYRYNLRLERPKLFAHFSNLAYSEQDMRLGEYYATQSTLLEDSILNKTIRKNTLELEQKYEAENRINQINTLQAEKQLQQYAIKRKNTLNYILIGGAVILLIISILSYRNYAQKRKLQQQRISELETEKQLEATEAVLKGEELERTRLAKDLHDGLGGMLSGIKYGLTNMKGNLIMTPENAQAFERSIDMLDSSIQEMRRVAHNMMPEALVKFGLDAALKDFCNDINQSGALHISYQSIGLENAEVVQTTAITIYRIVQELINNTMKHAAANNAIVQVTKINDQLSVTVEDDGRGFDTAILNAATGMGWSNIKSRVDFLKGTLDISSQPGKGTSVLLELKA